MNRVASAASQATTTMPETKPLPAWIVSDFDPVPIVVLVDDVATKPVPADVIDRPA